MHFSARFSHFALCRGLFLASAAHLPLPPSPPPSPPSSIDKYCKITDYKGHKNALRVGIGVRGPGRGGAGEHVWERDAADMQLIDGTRQKTFCMLLCAYSSSFCASMFYGFLKFPLWREILSEVLY